MTLMGHDTSDSIKIYFVLIGYLIEYKKKVGKNISKMWKKNKNKDWQIF